MKSGIWKVLLGFALGMAIAWLCSVTVSVDAQSLSSLLPKGAIAPVQITNLKAITANLDGFIPKKLHKTIKGDGKIDKHQWECALLYQIKDEIRID